MAKNVYLLITDLHLDVSKDNRFNYLSEILDAMQQVMEIASAYREKVDGKLVAMLLGDVFDGSSNVPGESMMLLEIMKYFLSVFDQAYAVVGNHEITYQRDNPFWYMASSIEDADLLQYRRAIQPKGITEYFTIPSTVSDGEVVFYFNHYGIQAKAAPEGTWRIGLFHQNVGSNDICKMWGTFDNVEQAAYVQSYTHCFFGHMHMAKGAYWLNEEHTCKGEWLGSLGRTSVTEIAEGTRDVNVPAVIIEDGKLVAIEDNPVALKSFEECVNVQTYEASKKTREELKARKIEIQRTYEGETLLQALQLKLDNSPLGYLFNLCARSTDEMLYEYRTTRDTDVIAEESKIVQEAEPVEELFAEVTPEDQQRIHHEIASQFSDLADKS